MMSIRHDKLVKLIGAGEMMDPKLQTRVLFTVSELMSGGSLDNRLWDTPMESVTWQERVQWACDIAEGMRFIHGKGFTHRDLKSQNCLYDKETSRAKVADFGMAKSGGSDGRGRNSEWQQYYNWADPLMLRTNEDLLMTQQGIGTVQWMAPELCANEVAISNKYQEVVDVSENKTSQQRQVALQSFYSFQAARSRMEYTQGVDVYAFGVMLCEMLAHHSPWKGQSRELIFSRVIKGERPAVPEEAASQAPAGWVELMNCCWGQLPEQRPPFDAVSNKVEMMIEGLRESGSALGDSEQLCESRPHNTSRRPSVASETLDIPTVHGRHKGNAAVHVVEHFQISKEGGTAVVLSV